MDESMEHFNFAKVSEGKEGKCSESVYWRTGWSERFGVVGDRRPFCQLQQPLFTLLDPHRAFLRRQRLHQFISTAKDKSGCYLLLVTQNGQGLCLLISQCKPPQACEPRLTFSLWHTATVPFLTLIVTDSSEILIYHSKLEIYIFLSLGFVPAI